jgi:hypothetical protein
MHSSLRSAFSWLDISLTVEEQLAGFQGLTVMNKSAVCVW